MNLRDDSGQLLASMPGDQAKLSHLITATLAPGASPAGVRPIGLQRGGEQTNLAPSQSIPSSSSAISIRYWGREHLATASTRGSNLIDRGPVIDMDNENTDVRDLGR